MPDVDAPEGCVFCRIVSGEEEPSGPFVAKWADAVAFKPKHPVNDDHVLVVPRVHVSDFIEDPEVTAAVVRRAAQWARAYDSAANLITSARHEATQTVFHLHVHVVPRAYGDGMTIPWGRGVRPPWEPRPNYPKDTRGPIMAYPTDIFRSWEA